MTEEIKEKIRSQIDRNPILLYMKGTRDEPMCGFSARVAQILNTLGVSYETVNVLENEQLRQGIKEFSDWPTIPQLYVNGKFIGGCDICEEMLQNGELEKIVNSAKNFY